MLFNVEIGHDSSFTQVLNDQKLYIEVNHFFARMNRICEYRILKAAHCLVK